jgi:hypothetical protein
VIIAVTALEQMSMHASMHAWPARARGARAWRAHDGIAQRHVEQGVAYLDVSILTRSALGWVAQVSRGATRPIKRPTLHTGIHC